MSEETFRWVIAGGVAISTLCILALAIAGIAIGRIVSRFQERIDDAAERVMPLVDTVRQLARENAPKISSVASRTAEIANNAKDISDVAKDQAHRFAEVGRDVADRTKAQVARMDAAVDNVVEEVQHAGRNVRHAIGRPVREATAVMAGVRAAVSAYANGKRINIEHVTQDEEMFI